MALIDNGQIQQLGSPAELKAGLGLHRLIIRTSELAKAEQALIQEINSASQIVEVSTLGDHLEVLVKDVRVGMTLVQDRLTQNQVQFNPIQPEAPTLENVFTTLLRRKGSIPKLIPFPRLKSFAAHRISNASNIAISARNLNRVFGSFHAVVDLNLDIHYGDVYGLLGANGAGKTTTIKMLCGLLAISSGEMSLSGETGNLRSAALRQRIGY